MSDWSTQASSVGSGTTPAVPTALPAGRPGPRGPWSCGGWNLRLAERLEVLVRVANLALKGPLHEQLVGDVADDAARKLVVHFERAVRAGPGRLVADGVGRTPAAGG